MAVKNDIEKIQEKLSSVISELPNNPGIYQFFNSDDVIIYIGKAKNLRKRVSSYFNRDNYDNAKVRILVSKIVEIKYVVVDTESDALLLENNLIKKYKPRYNILLKDDKTFPWLSIKKERFPRIIYTRNFISDGSEYFGPYTSLVMVKTLLSLVKTLYPLRTCNLDLTEDKILSKKYKPCLEFHVGNCKAPCISLQSELEYISNISTIREILKGNIKGILEYLDGLMIIFSKELNFEDANVIKDKIDLIKRYQSKSTIVNTSIHNVDVYSVFESNDSVCVNFLRVANGAIIQVHSVEIKNRLDESLDELLSIAILDIRQKMFSNSKEIIVPFLPDVLLEGVNYQIPKQGDKLKLLELSERNAKFYALERQKSSTVVAKSYTDKKENLLIKMKNELRLNNNPVHIECFDNSNIQGTNPVAACVVFRNGIPSKKDYRHFNVKTVIGPDDFATMREIIFRRYRRLLDENEPLPDLIVIDGGKGQLGAALESLRTLDIDTKVEVIGIAKRLEEIFRPGDPIPLYIDKNSSTLKIIQHLRNEAHRFGIEFHRLKRSKNFVVSELDGIEGIGDKLRTELYKKFQTIDAMKQANLDELKIVLGEKKSLKLMEHFQRNI